VRGRSSRRRRFRSVKRIREKERKRGMGKSGDKKGES